MGAAGDRKYMVDRAKLNMSTIPDMGSFTGQDIKAVVHLPISMDLALAQVAEWELQLEALSEQHNARLATSYGEVRIDTGNRDYYNQSVALSEKIQEYQEFIKKGITPARVLAELNSISYSIHREKFPVRALGSVYPKDFTRGPRTIAGTLVFTVFNRHVLEELLNVANAVISTGVAGQQDQHNESSPVLTDQIPPFDVTIAYNNELGESSQMVIYGVEIVNEGQVTSINDMITENEMQYVARDIDLMKRLPGRELVLSSGVGGKKRAEDVASQDEDFQKLLRRRNPFI